MLVVKDGDHYFWKPTFMLPMKNFTLLLVLKHCYNKLFMLLKGKKRCSIANLFHLLSHCMVHKIDLVM